MNFMDLSTLKVPSSVVSSANYVVAQAKDVQIDDEALNSVIELVKEKHRHKSDSTEDAFGTTGNLENDINLIFFETATNFCFWAQDETYKWQVNFKGQSMGGWYGLSRAFYRAVENDIPIYDASFMSKLTLDQAKEIFKGENDQPIPLLEVRVNNIIESANFLNQHYGGQAMTFLKAHDMSAPKIAEAVVNELPSYRDGAWYKDQWVWILKRAQILPSDLSQLSKSYPEFAIKDVAQLTAFADYRVPQVLRHYGVLKYSEVLAKIVDSKAILPSNSAAEIEIRASTIIACEKLKDLCGLSAAEIDLGLWLISQNLRDDPDIRPHHLSISGNY